MTVKGPFHGSERAFRACECFLMSTENFHRFHVTRRRLKKSKCVPSTAGKENGFDILNIHVYLWRGSVSCLGLNILLLRQAPNVCSLFHTCPVVQGLLLLARSTVHSHSCTRRPTCFVLCRPKPNICSFVPRDNSLLSEMKFGEGMGQV